MKTFLALVVLLAAAVQGQDKERRACLAEGPFEQLARHRTPVGLPVCAVDGSHRDAQAEAEILSFEEWKAQQLASGANDSAAAAATAAEPAPTLDESAGAPAEQQPQPQAIPPSPPSSPVPSTAPSLKDRYNYASTDCSARVQSAHRQARSPDSILSHKKDRYMLSPCAAPDQHVVVELCDDIRIDTVQLANFEFFSGVFKDFKVSASSTGEEWELAGEYTAKNARGVQSFHPQRDLPNFYRYVRIDFLSHYGSEFYCPVSLLRVYGLTQMEKFKQEMAEEQHRAAPAIPSAPPVVVVPAEPVTTTPTEATVEPSPSPSTDKARGTSDVALRPTLEVSDLEKCATVTRAATAPTTSSTTSPTSVPTADAAPLTPPASPPAAPPGTTTPAPKPSAAAPAPSPKPTVLTTGDSIYRTIMNRLAALEANSTLVVRFVEQQALTIREALRRMEEDVGRLDGAAKGVARALSELERERRELDEERVLLLRRVAALADEVVLEKRLGIAQLGLLVAVLLFLAVTRGSSAIAPLPLPRSRTSSLFLQRPRPRVVSDPEPQALLNPSFSFARKASPKPVPFPAAEATRTPRARSRTPRRIDSRPSIDLTSPRKPGPAPDSPRLQPSSSPRTREFVIARPRTPTHAVFSRLKRSNSHTTPGARKLARTAHLHEVRSPNAPVPDSGLFSPSPTPSDTEQEQEWVTEDEAAGRRDEPWKLDESPLARRRRKLAVEVEVAG